LPSAVIRLGHARLQGAVRQRLEGVDGRLARRRQRRSQNALLRNLHRGRRTPAWLRGDLGFFEQVLH
jgi:hypothetical protein